MREHPLACDAWQEHLAGWLVAQLPPEDEAALVDHLATCATCRTEADSLMSVAALTLGADPGAVPWQPSVDEPPPVDLADRILTRVGHERRSHRLRRGLLAAAAVVAVVIGVLALRPEGGSLDGEPVVFARRPAGVEASAVVAPEEGGSVVQLTASGLDPDVTYAFWLTPPGGSYPQRVAAGTFRPEDDGTVDVLLHSPLPAADMGRAWATTPDGQIALDTQA